MTTTRLLLAEPSATMRYVLAKHAESLGFVVDVVERYSDAINALQDQYQSFGHDYAGVLFGWPSVPDENAALLSRLLEQDEFNDMAVVVLSTDMRAETRAWVAGRDNTAVVAWKHYLDIEPKLSKLLDERDVDTDVFDAKFDNRDIEILVVDDSATIRHSLKELFSMQGYRVSVAATAAEAMETARNKVIDIAILDYYLAETTGDVLCRDLIADTGTQDIICAVLTGTYSDHIIKRSLRAGAVECMFKNESSELLLNRIDAISRFVRQRRTLENDRELLDDVVDSVAGPTIVLSKDDRIVYLSQLAMHELELDSAVKLLGQAAALLLEPEGVGVAGQAHDVHWRRPGGREIRVSYVRRDVAESGHKVLCFKAIAGLSTTGMSTTGVSTIAAAVAGVATATKSSQTQTPAQVASDALTRFELPETALPFLQQMQTYLNDADILAERVSLLVIDVFKKTGGGLASIEDDETFAAITHQRIMSIYRRKNHVVRLSSNRYAFLLRHSNVPQAYLLTRKIMQICNDSNIGASKQVASAASLLGINERANQGVTEVLSYAFRGVELVPSKGADQAYLMDLHQMLSVYPS